MSLSNAIDYKKVGFRWKGTYSASSTYENGDVVHKEGAAWKFNSSTGNFEIFARGNIDSLVKGEIITGGNYTTTGTSAQVLVVDGTGSNVEFNHRMDRNGQRCIALGDDGTNTGHRMQRNQEPSHYSTMFLMNDGSVRLLGYHNTGIGGVGDIDNDSAVPPKVTPFPKGIRISKLFEARNATYYIDTDGRLWANGQENAIPFGQSMNDQSFRQTHNVDDGGWISSAYWEGPPICAHEVLPSVFTSTDKIVSVVPFYDWHNGYHSAFAFSDTGKVWYWGDNINGHAGTGSTNSHHDAVVIPISETVPMNGVCCMPYMGMAGLRAVNGDYYTCGYGDVSNYNFNGGTITRFDKVEGGKIRWATMDDAANYSNQNFYWQHVVVMENGDVYANGRDPSHAGWGQYGDTTSQGYTNYNHSIGNRKDLLATGVRKAYCMSSGLNSLYVQMESDGHWRMRGSAWDGHGSMGATGSYPNHAQDFVTNSNFKLDPQYYHNNITKYAWIGYNYNFNHGLLDTQGRMAVFGFNGHALNGFGYNPWNNHGTNMYYTAGGSTLDDQFAANNTMKPADFYVPIRDSIVDMGFRGRIYYWPSTHYRQAHAVALTNKGDVFVWGVASNFNLGDNNYNAYTPARVRF